jgi:hypothetical protein
VEFIGFESVRIMAVLLLVLVFRAGQGSADSVRQSETGASQSKHGSRVGLLSNSTSTWEGTQEVVNLQLGPLCYSHPLFWFSWV